jgi:hypothetical protein
METVRRRGIVRGPSSPESRGVAAGGLFFRKIRNARTLVVGECDPECD